MPNPVSRYFALRLGLSWESFGLAQHVVAAARGQVSAKAARLTAFALNDFCRDVTLAWPPELWGRA